MIYLASPYSHPDISVRERRIYWVTQAAAAMARRGELVYSPLTHSHPIALAGDLPGGWDYWRAHDEWMLERCSVLAVLMLPGWRESVGVQAEIALARKRGIPITMVEGKQ